MNISMYPHYGVSRLYNYLRKLSSVIEDSADVLEASRTLTPSQRSLLRRNEVFLDKHKGQPGFVIVNGPSLAQQDISWLKNQITFCVSGFWKHQAVSIWEPTYYSLLDVNFFNEGDLQDSFYFELNKRIRKSTFFLPLYRGYEAVKKKSILPIEQCYYIASVGSGKSAVELTEIVQSFAGVSAFALAQAIYMGCSPIYLLGFDHDYLANRGVDKHFYAGGTLAAPGMVELPLSEMVDYDVEMQNNLNLWTNYKRLNAAADKKGIKILNATIGGYLDVFDRIDFNSLKSA
jgi:hypothetical protein